MKKMKPVEEVMSDSLVELFVQAVEDKIITEKEAAKLRALYLKILHERTNEELSKIHN